MSRPTRRPRTLAQLRADPRIEEMYQEFDGCFGIGVPSWWVTLVGYTFEGCHSIHERTIADVCSCMGDLERDPVAVP